MSEYELLTAKLAGRGLDITVPNVARIYDFFLGGKDNFVADRRAAAELMKLIPDSALACRQNRSFLGRVVEYLAGAGVRQFFDIGSGLPTEHNVHEIAQAVARRHQRAAAVLVHLRRQRAGHRRLVRDRRLPGRAAHSRPHCRFQVLIHLRKRTLVTAPEFDVTRPNVARIYNYLLGEWKDTYEADRLAAAKIIDVIPDAPLAARQNRDFLGRVVRYLVGEAGIRQIIDLGSGMPNMGNVHEVAHEIAPDTRVVYVDYDPVVIAHGNALLAERNVIMVQADVRRPADIFEDPQVIELIDFARPVAVLMIAIMHFIGDHERPLWVVDQYRSRLAPGSYIALSHVTDEDVKPDKSQAARHVYDNATAQVYPRSEAAIHEFFEGTELVMPGLADVASWRHPQYVLGENRRLMYGGVGKIKERSQ